MKNIQVIDGAENCVYDIFEATEEQFKLIFPDGTDVAFIEEVYSYADGDLLNSALSEIWKRPVRKSEVKGIHGTLFYGLEEKKIYYPGRRDASAINPDGSLLR
ncbi:MAG TPA: hypothetical protein VIO39_02870 [Methylotenera sp.]